MKQEDMIKLGISFLAGGVTTYVALKMIPRVSYFFFNFFFFALKTLIGLLIPFKVHKEVLTNFSRRY